MYDDYVDKLKKPNSGQFKKGESPMWRDGSPKSWKLTNIKTGETYIFKNKEKFWKETPGFEFLRYMLPNHKYTTGRRINWWLEQTL